MPTQSYRYGLLALALVLGAVALIARQRAASTAIERQEPTAPATVAAPAAAHRPPAVPVAPVEAWTVSGRVVDAIRTDGLPGAVIVFGSNRGAEFKATTDPNGYFTIRLPKLRADTDPFDPTAGAYWIDPEWTHTHTNRYFVGRIGRTARMTRNQRYLMYGSVEDDGADLIRGDRLSLEIAVFPEYDQAMQRESEAAARTEGCGFTPPPDKG